MKWKKEGRKVEPLMALWNNPKKRYRLGIERVSLKGLKIHFNFQNGFQTNIKMIFDFKNKNWFYFDVWLQTLKLLLITTQEIVSILILNVIFLNLKLSFISVWKLIFNRVLIWFDFDYRNKIWFSVQISISILISNMIWNWTFKPHFCCKND